MRARAVILAAPDNPDQTTRQQEIELPNGLPQIGHRLLIDVNGRLERATVLEVLANANTPIIHCQFGIEGTFETLQIIRILAVQLQDRLDAIEMRQAAMTAPKVKALVYVFDDSEKPSIQELQFTTLPRVGETIRINFDGLQVFEVQEVMHRENTIPTITLRKAETWKN